MTNGQRLAAVGLFLVAVVAGVLVASFAVGALGGSTSPTPTTAPPSTASVLESPSASLAAPSPSSSPSAGTSPSESPAASPTPAVTLTPTASPAQPATITFTELKLDATDNPDGLDRVITFQAQGPGAINVSLTAVSPRGQAIVCLKSASASLGCTTTADGTLSAQAGRALGSYTLTLRGDGITEPVVDVTLAFPTSQPSVRIKNARFDGTEFPDTNGIDVTVTPRVTGQLGLRASWGGHPFLYEIDLIEQGGTGGGTLADQGPATRVTTAFDVAPPNPWRLVLQNTETGMGPTGLTATISWP
jgi:hypothetical protein